MSKKLHLAIYRATPIDWDPEDGRGDKYAYRLVPVNQSGALLSDPPFHIGEPKTCMKRYWKNAKRVATVALEGDLHPKDVERMLQIEYWGETDYPI